MKQELSFPPRQTLSSTVFLGWGFPLDFLTHALQDEFIVLTPWETHSPAGLCLSAETESCITTAEAGVVQSAHSHTCPHTEDLLGSQYLFIYCVVGYRESSWKVFHYLGHYQRPNFFFDLNNYESTLSECLKLFEGFYHLPDCDSVLPSPPFPAYAVATAGGHEGHVCLRGKNKIIEGHKSCSTAKDQLNMCQPKIEQVCKSD